jgi:hypothetical protein
MLKQTLTKYKTIMMGYGSGSIFDYGCYLVSLVDGLVSHGYAFTIEGFNEILKAKGLWVGPYRNYIDVDNIAAKYPEIFTSFHQVNTWPSNDQLNTWINGNFVVVCQVNAAGIGGTGTHFVELKGWDGTVATIGDPWFGTVDTVTLHYGKYGNILSLRVFEIKPVNSQGGDDMEILEFMGFTQFGDPEKQKIIDHLGQLNGKCDWGNDSGTDTGGYLGQARREVKKLAGEKADLQTKLTACQTNQQEDPEWVANGKSIETTSEDGKVKTLINYAKKV